MRRAIAMLIAGLALAVGVGFGTTQVADAHHTHNATTICNDWIYGRSTFASHTQYVLTSTRTTYLGGHPTYAYCYMYNRYTFANKCVRIGFSTHNVYSC